MDWLKAHVHQGLNTDALKRYVKALYQPFACVIVNRLTQQIILIRDHFGLEPFYYSLNSTPKTQFYFGSTLPDILKHIQTPVHNEHQITQLLMDVSSGSLEYTDETYYENIYRVTPGHILTLSLEKNTVQREAYWVLQPGSPRIRYATDAEYDAHFAFLLEEAIHVSTQTDTSRIALEFSGGLDSSTLLTAVHHQNMAPHLFMHVGENTDERAYGDQLLHELNATHPIHYVHADAFDLIAVLDQCKQWFAGGAPYVFFMLAHNIHQAVRQQGCKVLLSGFGGDECASSHAPLRTYGADVGYKHLRATLPASTMSRHLIRTLTLAHPRLLYALQRIKAITPIKQKQLNVLYKPYNSLQEREQDSLQGALSYHIRMRIEYSAVVAKHMGFSYQYPLLYPPLVEFCFALPPEQKRRKSQNRLLMRRYLAQKNGSDLFHAHKKCGHIFAGTLPKCQTVYQQGQLNHAFEHLPYRKNYDYITKNKLVTHDELLHLNIMRYMFKKDFL